MKKIIDWLEKMILCFIKWTVYPYSLNYLIKNGNKKIIVNVYGLFNMFNYRTIYPYGLNNLKNNVNKDKIVNMICMVWSICLMIQFKIEGKNDSHEFSKDINYIIRRVWLKICLLNLFQHMMSYVLRLEINSELIHKQIIIMFIYFQI